MIDTLATYKGVHIRFRTSATLSINYSVYMLFILLFLGNGVVHAQFDIPAKPSSKTEQRAVYDYKKQLNSYQFNTLNQKLIRYNDTTSTQIVIAIIDSSNGEDLSLLGAQWGQKWGIGQADEDNGILILLAINDRKVDINTGYGIESIISDRDAERIINRIMIPAFKKGDFYGGLDAATNEMIARLEGNFTGTRKDNNSFPTGPVIAFVFFVVILIILSRKNHRGGGRGGRRRVAESLLDVIILSNMGRGTFGSSGGFGSGGSFGGGGGFGGGFGGGGFGGGGASGGW